MSTNIEWQGPPIDVVSLGTGDHNTLPDAARQCLGAAQVVIGARRHFDNIGSFCKQAEPLFYPSPISNLGVMLQHHHGKKLAVVASGDALFYGVGSMLVALVGRQHLRFHPNISSIQHAMHLLAIPWQESTVVSLHGRPLSSLRCHARAGSLLAMFTDEDNNPVAIAGELVHCGFASSRIHVCENLGSDRQKLSRFDASELAASKDIFSPLNICIAELGAGDGSLPGFPGIADHLFSTGSAPGYGMISKREVRLTILSMMQPAQGQVAWDIGAGCGSVAVEWARWNQGGTIYAVERDQSRVDHIHDNCSRFGVEQNCHIVHGQAPEDCASLPMPDCIFIGGSDGQLDELMPYCWQRLAAGGRLVATAVTADSRNMLATYRGRQREAGIETEWCEIAVSKNLPHSDEVRSLRPVQILACIKPGVNA